MLTIFKDEKREIAELEEKDADERRDELISLIRDQDEDERLALFYLRK